MRAGCFAAIAYDLRLLLRLAAGRTVQPSAVILDGRTVQSTPESDGHKRREGSKAHAAVDTLGYLLSVVVPPANAQERAQVAELAQQVQAITGETVELAYVDAGYTGPDAAAAAAGQGIQLKVVTLEDAQGPKRGFVPLPRRWVVERSFAWMARFRRLARDYERLPQTVAALAFLACVCLMLHQSIHLSFSS